MREYNPRFLKLLFVQRRPPHRSACYNIAKRRMLMETFWILFAAAGVLFVVLKFALRKAEEEDE
jgi:hypothetical protein